MDTGTGTQDALPAVAGRGLVEPASGGLESACARLRIPPDMLAEPRGPRETLHASLPIRMDDGARRAWRCRCNDRRGPTTGSVRVPPGVSLDEITTLAFRTRLKCAVATLPFGGAKGGVQVETGILSFGERERLSRAHIEAFARFIGPDRDILAPGMSTGVIVVAGMADAYGAITGKPRAFGGTEGRADATARGGHCALRHLEAPLGLAPDGFDPPAVMEHEPRTAPGAPGPGTRREADNAALLDCPCDVLVPAVLGPVVTGDNAERVAARVVPGMATGPVSPGRSGRARRGVTVGPGIPATPGTVTVSHLEWGQNRSVVDCDASRMRDRLRATIGMETRAIRRLLPRRAGGCARRPVSRPSAPLRGRSRHQGRLRRLSPAVRHGGAGR